jgi:drug/metabolite transporter (DMT)-like permease
MNDRRRVYVLMAALAVFWGGAFVAIKVLVEHASAVTVAFLRFGLTTLGLLALLAVVRPPRVRIERSDRPRIVLLGVLGVWVYHVTLNYGEHFVSANVASLIVASMPVMVAIASHVMLHEEMTRGKVLGIALALAGVVTLVLFGTRSGTLEVRSLLGALVTAIAPAAWATYTVLSKPLVHRYGSLRLITIVTTTGTVLLAPLALPSTIADLDRLTLADWGWIAFLAFACSVYGYAVWLYALGILEAAQVAVWVYFVPATAAVWAWAVLGETVTPVLALGAAMVVGGVVLTERARPRRRQPKNTRADRHSDSGTTLRSATASANGTSTTSPS